MEFRQKWNWLHDLYVLTDCNIVEMDIWMLKPVVSFFNMLMYKIEYGNIQEAERKIRG